MKQPTDPADERAERETRRQQQAEMRKPARRFAERPGFSRGARVVKRG